MGDDEKYWYNLSTGEVERGFESPAVDRAGPFDTAEEAARAPEIMAARSRAWAEDDEREDGWPADTRPDAAQRRDGGSGR